MFAKTLVVISMFAITFGDSVKSDASDIQEMISKAVDDILGEERIRQNEKYEMVIKEVDSLKVRNDRMEERIKYLEQENSDKDRIIISLQSQMNDIRETDSDTINDKARKFSFNRPRESLNKGHEMVNVHFSKNYNGVRRKRQVTPTHVTPTPRIAFTAYLTHISFNVSPGSAIKFDKALLNDGAGYNPYTGSFTAPVSGTYLFMFQFETSAHTFVRLTVDGRNLVDALVNPHVGSHNNGNMGGNSAIIHVGIGQAVLVEVYDTVGMVASSDKHHVSTFSGVLLYPDTA